MRGRRIGNQTIIMRRIQLPRDVVFVLHVAAAGGFKLNVDLRFSEVASTNDVSRADRGVDAAVILGPRSHSLSAVRGNGVEIGFADLLLLLLQSHRQRMTCCAPCVQCSWPKMNLSAC